jgi:hypothetical protein
MVIEPQYGAYLYQALEFKTASSQCSRALHVIDIGRLRLPWRVLASTDSTHLFSGTMSTIGYNRAAGYCGYCIVPTDTALVPTGTAVLSVLQGTTGTM